MATIVTVPQLVQQKLQAFIRLEPEFEDCFLFVEDVHGQKRFSSLPIADTVRYLHSLWVCECKTCLLSVPKTVKEYEGQLCLQLLKRWQEEDNTADVIAFLHRKLDMLPLADITRQIHEALHVSANIRLAQRLMHGRTVLLNRGMNLMQALDAVFALPEEKLLRSICEACVQYGHLPEQIAYQLEEMQSPLYSFVPHQALAQRNMQIMNKLGVNVVQKPADLPEEHSWKVARSTEPLQPFAEQVVQGYRELTAPWHNNVMARRFVDVREPTAKSNVFNSP
jgi:hypothetical protein